MAHREYRYMEMGTVTEPITDAELARLEELYPYYEQWRVAAYDAYPALVARLRRAERDRDITTATAYQSGYVQGVREGQPLDVDGAWRRKADAAQAEIARLREALRNYAGTAGTLATDPTDNAAWLARKEDAAYKRGWKHGNNEQDVGLVARIRAEAVAPWRTMAGELVSGADYPFGLPLGVKRLNDVIAEARALLNESTLSVPPNEQPGTVTPWQTVILARHNEQHGMEWETCPDVWCRQTRALLSESAPEVEG